VTVCQASVFSLPGGWREIYLCTYRHLAYEGRDWSPRRCVMRPQAIRVANRLSLSRLGLFP
jgi:hypothetical protein